jgi:drug/metabolite transporter (DMT)-like permease
MAGVLPAHSRERLGYAAVSVAVLTWGWSNVAIKTLSTTGLVASVYRLWFAVPVLWLIPIMVPSVRRDLTRDWVRATLGGGALFAIHQILFFSSLKMTSVINVAVIGALQPALVLLVAGPLFGEAVTLRALICSLIAVAGTALVVTGSAGAPHWSPAGDLIAGINLFAFTAYFLASKRFRVSVGALAYVIGLTTVAGVLVLGVALLTGQDLGSPHGYDWLILVLLAVFPGTLGHLLTNWAHSHVAAVVMSVMLLAVPVISAAGAAALLDETLNGVQIAGGAIVLIAIGTLVLTSRTEHPDELAGSAAETDAP